MQRDKGTDKDKGSQSDYMKWKKTGVEKDAFFYTCLNFWTNLTLHCLIPDNEIPSYTRFIPLGKIEVEGENSKIGQDIISVYHQKALDFIKRVSIDNSYIHH